MLNWSAVFVAQTPVHLYQGSNVALGTAAGKLFRVGVMTMSVLLPCLPCPLLGSLFAPRPQPRRRRLDHPRRRDRMSPCHSVALPLPFTRRPHPRFYRDDAPITLPASPATRREDAPRSALRRARRDLPSSVPSAPCPLRRPVAIMSFFSERPMGPSPCPHLLPSPS